jgi:oxaloacetate decarboxylase beta subunit
LQAPSGTEAGGLFYYLDLGIHLQIYPPLIFLGVGAMVDFGPLIANPRTLLLGAAAQVGIFGAFLMAPWFGFSLQEAAAIGIIGGADGPTSIYGASKLAPHLLGAIAVAAYSYMALVPLIQPPIMRLLTNDAERRIKMKTLRKVSQLEKIIFALVVMSFCVMVVPAAAPLLVMLFVGNILRESRVTERLVKAAQNEIINTVTIFLGLCVGLKMGMGDGGKHLFLNPQTLGILVLGVIAFCMATAGGVLMAKLMNVFCKDKINPLIGSAGVSAVPMAARVSHNVGQEYDKTNFLLMHAMGPNVAGVIGSAIAAGYFLTMLK